MAFKLVEILQDKSKTQNILEYLLPKLDPQDEFFLSQFILSLKNLNIETTTKNHLVDNGEKSEIEVTNTGPPPRLPVFECF